MKKGKVIRNTALSLVSASMLLTPTALTSKVEAATVGAQNTVTEFGFTGGYQEFVALTTGTYKLETWGAEGGGQNVCGPSVEDIGVGGRGGYSQGEINLTAGERLYIYVGGQGSCSENGLALGGWNGGGNGYSGTEGEPGAGGGGATDIRRTASSWDEYNSLTSRIIVAGGGGGGGEDNYDQGGAGGGLEGYSDIYGSPGGTQYSAGPNGGFGYGGSTGFGDGGGGGGGWYGGGADFFGDPYQIGWDTQGGSGGSGYIGGVSNASTQADVQSGNGLARISLVQAANAILTGITVSQRSLSLSVGGGSYISVTAQYSDGSTRDVTGSATYKATNTNILGTSPGYVWGINRGQTDLNVIYKEKASTGKTISVSARVKVTVN